MTTQTKKLETHTVKTTMTATVQWITPEVAKQMLNRNVENRGLKPHNVGDLARIMKGGKWAENGEPIIIDTNGVLKNGQHRLSAVIKARHSYWCVVVKGVEPDVMATIDNGTPRGLSDVLYLSGWQFCAQVAATVKAMIITNHGTHTGKQARGKIYNHTAMDYANTHKERIMDYIVQSVRIYQHSNKVVNKTMMTTALHVITKGKHPTKEHMQFMRQLIGVEIIQGTASAWFFRTKERHKKEGLRLNQYWQIGIIIQAWNLFVQGNAPVRTLKFDLANRWPDVL